MSKILIIDDNEQDRSIVKRALNRAGYVDVLEAETGEEGLEKAKESKPDLIICDINMPKKDGFEVLKEIRLDYNLRFTPVIMLTISTDFTKIKKAYEYKADFYLDKSSKPSVLLKNIPLLLELRKLRED